MSTVGTAAFIAWSSPVSPEQDEEFNTWYENVHMKEVTASIPACVSVKRWTVLGSGADGGVKRYVALYELNDGDAADAAAKLGAASAAGGQYTMTAAIDTAGADIQFLEPYSTYDPKA